MNLESSMLFMLTGFFFFRLAHCHLVKQYTGIVYIHEGFDMMLRTCFKVMQRTIAKEVLSKEESSPRTVAL